MKHTRENNPNWRGGKHISSHGYVKVLVGTKHHLADSSGYTYEHRLIVEKILGRSLKPNEKVHHIDKDRTNNHPDNLLVIDGNARHYVYHRKTTHLRKPGEPNLHINCKCGCGRILLRYYRAGRPRKYISGHNMKDGENERRSMVE